MLEPFPDFTPAEMEAVLDELRSGAEVAIDILCDIMMNATLPADELGKEMDVIRREIDMGLDDPDNVASRLLFSTAFLNDPRRHPVIGHRHLFDAIHHADLTGYHQARYTPDRCFVVISGDFDADEARKMTTDLTSDKLTGGGREPLVAIDPPQLGPRRMRETFAIPTSRISLAWKSPALDHPDAPAFDVLAGILGRGRASRLHRSLREEKELALEISAFSWTGPGREGLLAVSADADTAKRDALIDELNAALAIPGLANLWVQPIRNRIDMLSTGIKSPIGVKLSGADLASLDIAARTVEQLAKSVPGVSSAAAEAAAEAAASPKGAKGLICLPYFSGERTPIHDAQAKGAFFGLDLTHNRGDLFRAVLEGASARMSSRCVWQAMEEISVTAAPLRRKPTYWIHGSSVRTLAKSSGHMRCCQ